MHESIWIGGILFFCGVILKLFPPRSINHIYGYRTRRSKMNMENWKTANKISSHLLMLFGLILMLISILFSSSMVTFTFAALFILTMFIIVEIKLMTL